MRTSPLVTAIGALVGALVTAGVAGCGGDSHPGAVTITLYSGQHAQTTEALVARFERQTGIAVRERDGDEDQLAQEIEQEGSATPADVFLGANSPSLMALEGKRLLEPLPADVLGQVPAGFDSPDGEWVGVSARVSVLVYNPALIRPAQLPSSVLQLSGPKWKGKLALAPTETDFLPVVASVEKAVGHQAALKWLKGVRANASAHIEPDNEAITAAVNDGQVALGLIDHYYWYRLAKEVGPGATHSRIARFAPGDPGYVLDISGAAVLKSSKHQAAAEALAAFLVSQGGQQTMVASDSYEYPLRPGVDPPAGLEPVDQLHPNPITVSELGNGTLAFELEQEAQLI